MSTEILPEEDSYFVTMSLASAAVLMAAYYVFNVAQKPKVHTSNAKLRQFLEDHVPTAKTTYWPGPLLLGFFSWEGRLQSALGLSLRIAHTNRLPYKRKVLDLADGGQLALDILEPTQVPEGDKLVVLILPGLTSSSNTSYVKTLALSIVNGGATAAVLNNRGLGGLPLKTPRTYCATNNEDVREVLNYLEGQYSDHKMLAVGTSLGGMLLCRYLINHPEEAKARLQAAMVISICWDPMIGTASLETPFINKYVINTTLTNNLQYLANKHREVLEKRDCWDLNKVLQCKTLREFDDLFTAPQFGYASYEEYYRAASITPDISKFSIPVIALNSVDDPMQPGDSLPISQAESENSKLALIVTTRGGHLGFLEGFFPLQRPFHYMERMVQEVVVAVRNNALDLS